MGDEREGGADEEVLVVGLGSHCSCPALTAWDEGLGYIGGPLTSQLTCETGGANDLSVGTWDGLSSLDRGKCEDERKADDFTSAYDTGAACCRTLLRLAYRWVRSKAVRLQGCNGENLQ
jgi:hypothetical protein